jgi:hypothetical protein
MTQQSLPPAEPTAAEVLVRDPLSAVTRKERLYLLAVSMIGIAMVRTGLVPSKIATFGIELDKPNRSALLFLLALVTIYFLVAFILYAASDWTARYEALDAAHDRMFTSQRYRTLAYQLFTSEENIERLYERGDLEEYVITRLNQFDSKDTDRFLALAGSRYADMGVGDQAELLIRDFENPDIAAADTQPARIRMVASSRVFFEFVLPVLVGGYAIYELLARSFLY